jgi:hypothetical protein
MSADNRRKALATLIESRFDGVARQLALAIGKPERQINDMLSEPPRKSFGERVAREIEQKLNLPVYFLDRAGDYETQAAGKLIDAKQSFSKYKKGPIADVVAIMENLEPAMQKQVVAFAAERLVLQSSKPQNSTQRAGQ